jgi:sec-independent protein translocase protein TatB
MFGLSFGEVLVILVVALLVLGPSGLPKLARTLGKGMREFRQATGELRSAFEGEFYKLDREAKDVARAVEEAGIDQKPAPAPYAAPPGAVPHDASLLTAGGGPTGEAPADAPDVDPGSGGKA